MIECSYCGKPIEGTARVLDASSTPLYAAVYTITCDSDDCDNALSACSYVGTVSVTA